MTIEAGASVWYGCVLRGDDGPIVVRERANVQDLSLLHSFPETTTEIGPGATVAHQCIVHGAVLEEEALVGNGAIVLDNARIGARSMVAAGSLVTPGTQIPAGVLALGSPVQGQGSDRRHAGGDVGAAQPGALPRPGPAAPRRHQAPRLTDPAAGPDGSGRLGRAAPPLEVGR